MKKLTLTNGGFAIVDDDVFPFINKFSWYLDTHGRTRYARRYVQRINSRNITAYLHHCIAGRPVGRNVVDHINGNGLDNRRKNLRIVSIRMNLQNKEVHRNGRLIGSIKDSRGRFKSQIKFGKEAIFLGVFKTEIEAHAAYLGALKSIEE